MAVDYVKGDIDMDSQYVVLAKLCAELCDGNCLALYLPQASTLVPGEEFARGQLNKIIVSRNVDVS